MMHPPPVNPMPSSTAPSFMPSTFNTPNTVMIDGDVYQKVGYSSPDDSLDQQFPPKEPAPSQDTAHAMQARSHTHVSTSHSKHDPTTPPYP